MHVCIVATPDSTVSPVTGIYETLHGVDTFIAPEDEPVRRRTPFEVEIVSERAGLIKSQSGLALTAHRSVDEVERADIVIVPSFAFGDDGDWIAGRYPKLIHWLRRTYEQGGLICSACTGANLTAEAGLLNGEEATVHWAAERTFRSRHPDVVLRPDEVLVVSGPDGRLVTSGAATAWHDLVLYLIAQYVGPATAQAVARFLLFEWHHDGQAAFRVFNPREDHGDAAVLTAQRAIAENYAVASPVEEMARWSGLAPRTFKRRFTAATSHTPIAYVQRLRVERAKRLLEGGDTPIEEISWAVGYEDAASFRRLFKRVTGLTPGAYRQRFHVPSVPAAE